MEKFFFSYRFINKIHRDRDDTHHTTDYTRHALDGIHVLARMSCAHVHSHNPESTSLAHGDIRSRGCTSHGHDGTHTLGHKCRDRDDRLYPNQSPLPLTLISLCVREGDGLGVFTKIDTLLDEGSVSYFVYFTSSSILSK